MAPSLDQVAPRPFEADVQTSRGALWVGGREHLFCGLVRAEFGFGMSSAGVDAARKGSLEGRCVSLCKGGTYLSFLSGVAREATKELRGWRLQGVMKRMYNKTRPEEVAPEMRGALGRARPMLIVEEFVKDLELEAPFFHESVAGLPLDKYGRTWFHCFRMIEGHLAPGVARLMCPNFLIGIGRRMRERALSDMQKRATLPWGTESRALLQKVREAEP